MPCRNRVLEVELAIDNAPDQAINMLKDDAFVLLILLLIFLVCICCREFDTAELSLDEQRNLVGRQSDIDLDGKLDANILIDLLK